MLAIKVVEIVKRVGICGVVGQALVDLFLFVRLHGGGRWAAAFLHCSFLYGVQPVVVIRAKSRVVNKWRGNEYNDEHYDSKRGLACPSCL